MAFWAGVCCWVIELRVACIIIAVILMIVETTLFLVSFLSGDVLFEFDNNYSYAYAANALYFPVVFFPGQIIASSCLIISAIWRKIPYAGVYVGYQSIEFTVFTLLLLDQLVGDPYTPEETILRVKGGPLYYVSQIFTFGFKLYFLFIVGCWINELMMVANHARLQAHQIRQGTRAARRQRAQYDQENVIIPLKGPLPPRPQQKTSEPTTTQPAV